MRAKDIPGYVMMYLLAGTLTVVVHTAATGQESITASEYIGVMILWPLFLIKYVALAVYYILSAGFGALL